MRSTVIVVMTALTWSAIGGEGIASVDEWEDSFYQYRIYVDLDVASEGWNVVALSESDISTAIGELEEYSFDPIFLAYNHVRVVEVDEFGFVTDLAPDAGFHLIGSEEELAPGDPTLPLGTKKDAYYLVDFVSEGGRFPPTVGYEQVFPVGEPPRTHAYMSSYVPRLLPKKRSTHRCLLRSDGSDLKLSGEKSAKISVRECTIAFLANFETSGRKHFVLYYQPFGAHYLKIPNRCHPIVPASSATVTRIATAEKYVGKTKYGLPSNDAFRVWFADTTIKLTPNSPSRS